MPTEGIKVAQKGYSADTCADYQLLYSSQWPSLKIVFQGAFSVMVAAGARTSIKTHSLGYVPFWLSFGQTLLGPASTAGYANSNLSMTTTDLYVDNSDGIASLSLAGRYCIYSLALTTNYTAPTLITAAAGRSVVEGYGIKVALPGFDVSTSDWRNFSIHSACRTLMTHKVAYQALTHGLSAPEVWQLAHGLNYVPMYFLFTTFDDTYWFQNSGYSDAYNQAIDATNFTLNYDASQGYLHGSVVVLKDPETVG